MAFRFHVVRYFRCSLVDSLCWTNFNTFFFNEFLVALVVLQVVDVEPVRLLHLDEEAHVVRALALRDAGQEACLQVFNHVRQGLLGGARRARRHVVLVVVSRRLRLTLSLSICVERLFRN